MRFATRLAAAAALLTSAVAALAHDGHGLQASHWHATDSAGFVVVLALATVALWLGRK
jgi:hypothetical protein